MAGCACGNASDAANGPLASGVLSSQYASGGVPIEKICVPCVAFWVFVVAVVAVVWRRQKRKE